MSKSVSRITSVKKIRAGLITKTHLIRHLTKTIERGKSITIYCYYEFVPKGKISDMDFVGKRIPYETIMKIPKNDLERISKGIFTLKENGK